MKKLYILMMLIVAVTVSNSFAKELEQKDSKMKFYSVLEVTPTSQEWVLKYIEPANRVVARYGGKFLARTSSHERLEGKGPMVGLRIIIEWPSKEAALNFTKDPEYVPHLKARIAGSVSHHYLIEGKDELAN